MLSIAFLLPNAYFKFNSFKKSTSSDNFLSPFIILSPSLLFSTFSPPWPFSPSLLLLLMSSPNCLARSVTSTAKNLLSFSPAFPSRTRPRSVTSFSEICLSYVSKISLNFPISSSLVTPSYIFKRRKSPGGNKSCFDFNSGNPVFSSNNLPAFVICWSKF